MLVYISSTNSKVFKLYSLSWRWSHHIFNFIININITLTIITIYYLLFLINLYITGNNFGKISTIPSVIVNNVPCTNCAVTVGHVQITCLLCTEDQKRPSNELFVNISGQTSPKFNFIYKCILFLDLFFNNYYIIEI